MTSTGNWSKPIRGSSCVCRFPQISTWLSLPSLNSSPSRCRRHLACIGSWKRGQLHAATLVLQRVVRGVDERRIAVLPSVTAGVYDLEEMWRDGHVVLVHFCAHEVCSCFAWSRILRWDRGEWQDFLSSLFQNTSAQDSDVSEGIKVIELVNCRKASVHPCLIPRAKIWASFKLCDNYTLKNAPIDILNWSYSITMIWRPASWY